MRLAFLSPVFLWALHPAVLLARGDGTFEAPLGIGLPRQVSIAAGDFNRDGKRDLATTSGSGTITILLQGRTRLEWEKRTVPGGSFYLRAADLDGDGDDDLVSADPGGRTASVVKCKGDGSFEKPLVVATSGWVRWIAVGDWNADGKPDLATANYTESSVGVYRGSGDGSFSLVKNFSVSGFPHVLEALDYDGDGTLDLMAKLTSVGVQPLRGRGDGNFDPRPIIQNLGDGGHMAVGDFNKDGKGDLALSCCGAGILGNGTYRKTLSYANWPLPVIGDLDGDGFEDLLLRASNSLIIHFSKGNGEFLPPSTFPLDSSGYVALVLDLDGDGPADIVFSDEQSLKVLWGQRGRASRELPTVSGGATAVVLAKFDSDPRPDLFIPSSTKPQVDIYLNPGRSGSSVPSLAIPIASPLNSLEVADLDGDEVPDLVGLNRANGVLVVALLEPSGRVKATTSLPAGAYLSDIMVDQLDEGKALDLAMVSTGSDAVLVFSGLGGGVFGAAKLIPTIAKPRNLAGKDLDGDGRSDLAVISTEALSVQFGKGNGEFSEPVVLQKDVSGSHNVVTIADTTGDGNPDVLALETRSQSILSFKGDGKRGFEALPPLKVGEGPPVSLRIEDLDGDGLRDLTVASYQGKSISVFLNGPQGFARSVPFWVGFAPLGHRVADLDLDGAFDIVAYTWNRAAILPGQKAPAPSPGRFLRGDVDGDARIELSDPIRLINMLFLGGEPLPCEDAADANDDGGVDVTDAVAILNRLFLGGRPLPEPGGCGADPTQDGLSCASGCEGR